MTKKDKYALSLAIPSNAVRGVIHSKINNIRPFTLLTTILGNQTRWVLIQPTQSPVFVGETARRNTPCVSSPIPQLAPIVNASATRLLANQSIITWPPVDVNNPLDAYLSDCEAGTFCSSNGICVDSLPDGAACESTHQCSSSSQCIENRCIDTSSSNSNPWDDQQFDKSHTAAVIAAVVVSIVALLVCLVCIAYFYYYYRHQHKYKSEQPQVLSQPVLSNSPSMQQQQLQFHLQCQRWQDPKATPPPPPYTP